MAEDEKADIGTLNMLRKCRIGNGGIADLGNQVTIERIEDFDIQATIFKTVRSPVSRRALKEVYSMKVSCKPEMQASVEAAYNDQISSHGPSPTARQPLPRVDDELFEFMLSECDFSCEHADGSFLDHLRFVSEYAHCHFHSPRVLLLHSIFGVGTNIFPMRADQIPKLRSFLTEDEFLHVAAFPSVLRLLLTGTLLAALKEKPNFESVQFYRVLDNVEITMTSDQLWTHLNFHLIHMLDFVPAANWETAYWDRIFEVLRELHPFLAASGKLQAKVDLGLQAPPTAAEPLPKTLFSMIYGRVPTFILRDVVYIPTVKALSREIGHNTDFTIR